MSVEVPTAKVESEANRYIYRFIGMTPCDQNILH